VSFTGGNVFTIRDLDTLKVVSDPLRVQIFEILIETPHSPRQIAEKLGLPTGKLYYHLGLMERHGLIAVAETRTVANLIEKLYLAAAPLIDIDPALLSFQSLEGQANLQNLLASTLTATREDILRSFQARAFSLEQGAAPAQRSAVITRHLSRLSPERADELRQRLLALLREFEAAGADDGGDEAQLYAFTAAFYPSFYYPTGE
jgi:DNA-binding transcriptional ArsR family regulator